MLQFVLDSWAIRQAGRSTSSLGRAGEAVAARTLRRSGYSILGRNLHVPMGEADVLCLDPDRVTIVLVEVKTREIAKGSDAAYLPPEAAITAEKREKLRKILHHLLRANRWSSRSARIDVIAIDWRCDEQPLVRHHIGAVAFR